METIRWTLASGWGVAALLLIVFAPIRTFGLAPILATVLAVFFVAGFGAYRRWAEGLPAVRPWLQPLSLGIILGLAIHAFVSFDVTGVVRHLLPESIIDRTWIAFGTIVIACAVATAWLKWRNAQPLIVGALMPSVTFAAVALATLVAQISGLPELQSYLCSQPFNNQEWIAKESRFDRPTSRQCMVDDLLANHLRPGMNRSDVAALLGALRNAETAPIWDYVLGPTGILGIEGIEIEFDRDDRVMSIRKWQD